MNKVFLDSSYAVALLSPGDERHQQALALADRLKAEKTRIVTSHAVMIEIGNGLAKARSRAVGITLLKTLQKDRRVEIVHLEEALWQKAFELFEARPDKEWGMTDCISFVIMQQRGLTDALTADDHFRQAGFRAMLQENP